MSAEEKIAEGARPYLDEGEEILAAFVARPRGWTQSVAGARGLGRRQQAKAHEGAEAAEFELASPMALAITPRRLLSLELGTAAVGAGEVKRLVSAAPLAEVDSIKVKRLLMGKVVTVTVHGQEFKLEAGAGANAKGLAEAFERERGAVA
ncbi:MAG TPA: hypothetical protein VHF89_09080 [Solirubrobacteraceae bacterium]|nr:hypothetical protein [Solirubrobacteraceae bacterium]